MRPSLSIGLPSVLLRLLPKRRGSSGVDYAVLVALIAVAVLGAVVLTGDRIRSLLVASEETVTDGIAGLPLPEPPAAGGAGGSPPPAGQGVWSGDGTFALSPLLPAQTRVLVLTNTGAGPLTFGAPAIAGPDVPAFQVLATDCGPVLPPGESCTVSVEATAAANGTAHATLAAAGVPGGLPLLRTATGFDPLLAWSGDSTFAIDGSPGPDPLPRTATRILTLTNQGFADAVDIAPVLAGPDIDAFALVTDCPSVLLPSAACTVTLTASATTNTTLAATLIAGGPASVSQPLHAEATGFAPALAWTAVPADFSMDTANGGVAQPATAEAGPAQTATLTNTGTLATGPVTVGFTGPDAAAFTIVSDSCSGQPLAPGASCTVDVALAAGLFPGDYSLQLTAAASPTVAAPARTQRVIGPRLLVVFDQFDAGNPATLDHATWSAYGNAREIRYQNVGNASTGPMTATDNSGRGFLYNHALVGGAEIPITEAMPNGTLTLAAGETGRLRIRLAAGSVLNSLQPLVAGPNAFSAGPVAIGGFVLDTISATYTGTPTFAWSGGGAFTLTTPTAATNPVDQTFTLTNTGNIPAAPAVPTASGSGPGFSYSILTTDCGAPLAPNQTCTATVRASFTDSTASAPGTLASGAATVALSGSASGCLAGNQVFTTSGTFVRPGFFTDCGTVRVLAVGGGGGGGSGHGNAGIAGGGGASGQVSNALFAAADIPASVVVTVGLGGAGGTIDTGVSTASPIDSIHNGSPGGASSFGALLTARGGGQGITGVCWWGGHTCFPWPLTHSFAGYIGNGGGIQNFFGSGVEFAGSAGGAAGIAGGSNGGSTAANTNLGMTLGTSAWNIVGAVGQGPFPLDGFVARTVSAAAGGAPSAGVFVPIIDGFAQDPPSYRRAGGGGGGVALSGATPAQAAENGTVTVNAASWSGDLWITSGGFAGEGFGAGGGGGARALGAGGRGASGLVYIEWR